MTGKELIQWIIENHAEDKIVVIEHRDEGGTYHSAERLGEFTNPMLAETKDETFGIVRTILYDSKTPNAIVL